MMTNIELQSKTIRWLRFPLAVAIVFIHQSDLEAVKEHLLHINCQYLSHIDDFICLFVSDLLLRVATPLFSVFSGFLFFYKVKEWNLKIYFEKIKRKMKTLVVPYMLWNIIPIIVTAVFLLIKFDGSLSIFMNQLWENNILNIFWNYHSNDAGSLGYPYNIPMWFVRDLIVVTFLAPIVYYYIKRIKLVGVIILGVCFYTEIPFPILSIKAFFFFSLGAYFSIHGKNMIVEMRKGSMIWLLITVIAMILSMYYQTSSMYNYFRSLYIIFGSITLINIGSYLIEHGHIHASDHSFLSKTSFFIFSAHNVFLLGLSKRLISIIIKSESTFFMIIKYFITPIVCVCICLGLYYIASKITPKLLKILTGSR